MFREQVRTCNVARGFAVDLWNTHSLRLEFTKDGFDRCDQYFELVRREGSAEDAAPARTQPVYGPAPLRRQSLRIVMKRTGSPLPAATRPAA